MAHVCCTTEGAGCQLPSHLVWAQEFTLVFGGFRPLSTAGTLITDPGQNLYTFPLILASEKKLQPQTFPVKRSSTGFTLCDHLENGADEGKLWGIAGRWGSRLFWTFSLRKCWTGFWFRLSCATDSSSKPSPVVVHRKAWGLKPCPPPNIVHYLWIGS